MLLFEVNYSSENGPTSLHGIQIKTQSPKGSIKLTRQGNAHQLANELLELQQDLKQSYSETRRSEKIYTNDLFALCNQLGCDILGSEEEKLEFLKAIEINGEILDATKVLHDDCGAEIWAVALFGDSKYYYNLQCVRTWPGYQP